MSVMVGGSTIDLSVELRSQLMLVYSRGSWLHPRAVPVALILWETSRGQVSIRQLVPPASECCVFTHMPNVHMACLCTAPFTCAAVLHRFTSGGFGCAFGGARKQTTEAGVAVLLDSGADCSRSCWLVCCAQSQLRCVLWSSCPYSASVQARLRHTHVLDLACPRGCSLIAVHMLLARDVHACQQLVFPALCWRALCTSLS